MYGCSDCNKRFSGRRREKLSLQKQLWCDYVFHKQTLRELKKTYHSDKRTIRRQLHCYTPPKKQHYPRRVHLVVDATYWGERKEHTSWCSVVARDPIEKENLWWDFEETETTSVYLRCRKELEALGYTILSVTGDGFGGIRQAFSGIPFQMCLVHMERLVVKGTTKNPQLEAGIVLLALTKSLYTTDSTVFNCRLNQYIEKYRTFLNEKTINPITGEQYWTHAQLRMAVHSLLRFQKWLFTFEQNKNIPSTTNSLEGHFSHIEDIVNVHRGLSREHKEKVLHSIFLASTIAPSKKMLDEIL
jgi:hypothetical protein